MHLGHAHGISEAALGSAVPAQSHSGTHLGGPALCSGLAGQKWGLHVLTGVPYCGQVDWVPVQDLLALGALAALPLLRSSREHWVRWRFFSSTFWMVRCMKPSPLPLGLARDTAVDAPL